MVNISKIGDSAVKFVFTDSDHYLYGNGEIEVPVNSLLLVIDESDMVTFKKLSGDPFLSFRADNSNLGTKAAIEQFYKDNMVGSTGGGSESGITSGEVQTMIDNSLEDYYTDDEVDAALSGKASVSDVAALENEVATKADTSAVTAVANDVQTVSGQVATKVAISDFNAYSAATDSRLAEDEEVTAAALNNLDENKQDALQYYSEDTTVNTATIHIENTDDGTVGEVYVDGASVDISALRTEEDEDNGSMVETRSDINGNNAGIAMSYEKLVDDEEAAHSYLYVNENNISLEVNSNEVTTTLEVNDNGVSVNGDAVATESYVDAAITGKVDTSAITSSVTSASTDSEIPTAKATYNAIQAGGGGGATYSAGTNIDITNDTINCTLPITANSTSFIAGTATNVGNNTGETLVGITSLFSTYNNQNNVIIGYNAKGTRENVVIGCNATGGSRNNYDWCNIAIGYLAKAVGGNRVAIGWNVTASGSTKTNINDQITVDTNNQVYIKDKTNTTDVCIQDAIAALGGLKFVQCTQAEYDSMVSGGTVDSSTIYFITNVVS